MTQQGTIKKLLPGGRAEVEVTRRSACGHDCAKCGGCGGLETQTLYVTARNHTDAGIGDRVLLEGESGHLLGLAALVYMLPLVLFFVGYAIGSVTGGGAAGAKKIEIVKPPGRPDTQHRKAQTGGCHQPAPPAVGPLQLGIAGIPHGVVVHLADGIEQCFRSHSKPSCSSVCRSRCRMRCSMDFTLLTEKPKRMAISAMLSMYQ